MVRKQLLVKGDGSDGGGGSTRKMNMARFVSRKRSGRRSPSSASATVAVAVTKAGGAIGIGKQITRFRTKIKVTKAKHDDDAVANAKKEADAKINNLVTELNVKEALLDREGEENKRLGSQINKFKSKIMEAKATQEEADEQNIILEEEARKAKEHAEGKINTLISELNEKEARLGNEGKTNAQLSSKIATLNKEIAIAMEKQEAIDAEATRIKGNAKERVQKQERELEMLRSRLKAERGANTSLAVAIAELNHKIQAAKKKQEEADGEAELSRQKVNRRVEEQKKELAKMEARMKDADAQNLALESEVDRLKSRIEHATNEKQELNNALVSMMEEAEEKRMEAEAKIEARNDELRRMEVSWKGAAARNVALEEDIKTRDDQLKMMEGNFRDANDKNSILSDQISELRSKIEEARAKQEEADQYNVALEGGALRAKQQANLRIDDLKLALTKAEAKLNEGGEENKQLSCQILKLNKQIATDTARQEALTKEADEIREKANKKVQKQEEKLSRLESKLDVERGTNASLNASIAELNIKIQAAKTRQQEATASADRAREDARRKADEQMKELKRMEDRMKGANAHKGTLGSEVERLKSEIGHATNERRELDKALKVMAKEAEAAKEQAEAEIEKRTCELGRMEEGWKEAVARNSALEAEMAELARTMSEDRRTNLKTIEELRRTMSRERAAQQARDEARDEAESSRVASLEELRELQRAMSDNQKERRMEVDGHINEIARLRRDNKELLRIKQEMSFKRRASRRAIRVNSAEQASQAEVEVEYLGMEETEATDDDGTELESWPEGGEHEASMLDRIMDVIVGSSTNGSSLQSGGWRRGSGGTLSMGGDSRGSHDDDTCNWSDTGGSTQRSSSLVPTRRNRETLCELAGEEAESIWSCWSGVA